VLFRSSDETKPARLYDLKVFEYKIPAQKTEPEPEETIDFEIEPESVPLAEIILPDTSDNFLLPFFATLFAAALILTRTSKPKP
jgi:hypothetical protein